MRLLPDLTNQIGQGHLRQRSLEAVLGLGKNGRHAFLKVTADRTPLFYWIRMNRKRWGCRASTINVQKRYLLRGTGEPARAILTARGDDQACP